VIILNVTAQIAQTINVHVMELKSVLALLNQQVVVVTTNRLFKLTNHLNTL